MSYCRWSSDDWKCDLYCYEDFMGGWTTHVAGRKAIGVPKELPFPYGRPEDKQAIQNWVKSHQEVMEYLKTAEYRTITLPHAGETFNDATLGDFKARLLQLRWLGYNFPDYVLEAVDEEIKELGE